MKNIPGNYSSEDLLKVKWLAFLPAQLKITFKIFRYGNEEHKAIHMLRNKTLRIFKHWSERLQEDSYRDAVRTFEFLGMSLGL